MKLYFLPDINAASTVLPNLSYTFIFHKQLHFALSGLKIIFHGNPNNNLESPCILFFTHQILDITEQNNIAPNMMLTRLPHTQPP
jgi:hypothetical protein